VFREHFLTCFISDPLGYDLGIGNICWECDYPHSDSMWPGAPDPFAHVPREQATVGALRGQARATMSASSPAATASSSPRKNSKATARAPAPP
jgi:hypothetical protein